MVNNFLQPQMRLQYAPATLSCRKMFTLLIVCQKEHLQDTDTINFFKALIVKLDISNTTEDNLYLLMPGERYRLSLLSL